MPDRFNAAKYTINGLPEVDGTLTIGPRNNPKVYVFRESDAIDDSIMIGSSVSSLRLLIADVINGTEGLGFTATVSGSDINLVPPTDKGDQVVGSNATSVTTTLLDPDVNGVLLPN